MSNLWKTMDTAPKNEHILICFQDKDDCNDYFYKKVYFSDINEPCWINEDCEKIKGEALYWTYLPPNNRDN